jgi:outer membrane lipoprotein SlyB
MKIFSRLAFAGAVAALAFITGCASTSSGSVYSGGQARQEQTVRMGVVESVRQVTIEGSKSGVGTIAGGAIGGVAGSNIGGGSRGSAVGTILGAVAGGLAGNAIEQGTTKKQGLEITVKLDNGELRAITQDADESFRPGERVRLLSGGGVTRVTH